MTNIAVKKSENRTNNVSEVREIVMTSHIAKRIIENPLAAQKLSGIAMLIIIAAALIAGSDLAGLAILTPMAFSAVFSKHKLMDFGIFSRKG